MPKVAQLKFSDLTATQIMRIKAMIKAGKVTSLNIPKEVGKYPALARMYTTGFLDRVLVSNPTGGKPDMVYEYTVKPSVVKLFETPTTPEPTVASAAQPKDRLAELERKLREDEAKVAATRRELLELKVENAVPQLLELAVTLTPDEFALVLKKASQRDPEFDRKVDRFLASESPQQTATPAVQEPAHTTAPEARA